MPLDDILRTFARDLAVKGKVKGEQQAMDMNRCSLPPSITVCALQCVHYSVCITVCGAPVLAPAPPPWG